MAAFRAGAVCDSMNATGLASNALNMKHLRILETEWHPFATRDPSAPHGWVGFDIALLDRVAEMLNFTFEIHEGTRLPGEPWSATLLRTSTDADLWASWWTADDPRRINGCAMLSPHIDTSPVLVTVISTLDQLRTEARSPPLPQR